MYPNNVKVFFIEHTDLATRSLRRFCFSQPGEKCACPGGCHSASAPIEQIVRRLVSKPTHSTHYTGEAYEDAAPVEAFRNHPAWPTHAPCGYAFKDADEWQIFEDQLYRKPDGSLITLRDAPVGACWDCGWLRRKGPDGRALAVKCPDGREWCIDARCSNCTLPNDNEHRCWVRHGRPEDGSLHVDKNGLTCAAGAGSIATGKWHGFLHHGVLHA